MVVEVNVFVNDLLRFGEGSEFNTVNTFRLEYREEVFSQSVVIRVPTS